MLQECGAALLWITHDPDQPLRVGGRLLELPTCTITHIKTSALEPDLEAGVAVAAGVGGA